MNQNKFILIASNGKGAGKTSLSKHLLTYYNNYNVISRSFATSLRNDCFYLVEKYGQYDLEFLQKNYNNFKDHNFLFNDDLDSFEFRTLLHDYSKLMSKFFGKKIWAYDFLKHVNQESENTVCIVDDLRRSIELEYLIDQVGKENIITVYINKLNVDLPTDLSFEGQIVPEEMDFILNFKSDWSNFSVEFDYLITNLNKIIK